MSDLVVSRRLGTLSAAQLQRALDRFGLGRLLGAAPVPFGLFGQNVFLSSTAGEFVLRGCPHYDWQFPCERFFAALLHEQTHAPVPWPYLLDAADDIFGWSYLLMPRMPGLQLADPAVRASLAPCDRLGVAHALGACLAEVHALAWPVAGAFDLAAGTVLPDALGHRERVIGDIRGLCSRPGSLTPADLAWVEGLIEANGAALDAPFAPGVVLRDYKEANVVVSQLGDVWRVSGVFDLMECSMGNREQDLVRQTTEYLGEDVELARAFVQAYLERRPPTAGLRERLRLHALRDRLIIWDYVVANHGAWQKPGETLRTWAGRSIIGLDQMLAGLAVR